MQAQRFYFLFSLAIIAIIVLPVGIANLILGFIYHDSPCIQCWGERQSMVYIALGGLFIVRYGLKPKYIAMLVLVVCGGLYQSFYHLGNHALEDVGQGFALAIFGLHTQFWAELVFWATLLVLGLLLFKAPGFESQNLRKLTRSNLWAFGIFSALVASNMVQAFISTGPFPYLGHGDPIRFSWRMAENIWSTSNWGHMGFPRRLGKRVVDGPILADSSYQWESDYRKAPLDIHKSLTLLQTQVSPLKLNAPISDLNFLAFKETPKTPKLSLLQTIDADIFGKYTDGCAPALKPPPYTFSPETFAGNNALLKNTFLIATQKEGLYVVDEKLQKILAHLVLDKHYSVTVEHFVGANMVGNTIRLMGTNKSSVDVAYNPKAHNNFANFLEGAHHFDEIGRSRLRTSRASTYYVLSARSDGTHTYMLTVPNKYHKQLILVGMLDQDLGLSSEAVLRPLKNNPLKKGRSLGEFYITGLAFYQGRLFALSKAYNALLVINPYDATIIDAYGLPPSVKNPTALTFINNALIVSGYADKHDIFYTLDISNLSLELPPAEKPTLKAPILQTHGC
ncbi:disulfide bond formation protein B [Helicobacter ailurogastricus]|uniref:disulfide bond formation protein B n=1 Tax=Helicobacter ailurogastricus TaxID=1578720 RepID=UPI00244D8967|nr:disulfide bond formation protein B [Helicobacter ailurogastricus]GMB92057.1 Disulfide bond formation protein [Helicobacter ailurogastricus]